MKISNRSDIINYLIEKNGYKRYLEIGVRDNKNFNRIKATHKDGVDPAGKCNYIMTSDKFFATIPDTQVYGIIFIDGLHLKDQVLRDVNNSLKHLDENGTIVMHDCNPIAKEHAMAKQKVNTWNGTVWEAFVELRMTRKDLFMCTVKKDTGCGIIRRGEQDLFKRQKMSFEFFNKNRKEILNLITAEEFVNIF
jgi:hypothetical protein